MANGAGRDLHCRCPAALNTKSVVLSCEVADERSNAIDSSQACEQLFKERGLAGSRTRNETDDMNAGSTKLLPQIPGKQVVLFEHALTDFNDSRFSIHLIDL